MPVCSSTDTISPAGMPALPGLGSNEFVTDEGELAAVGGPGGDINGALAAKEFRQFLAGSASKRQQAQADWMIDRMAGDFLFIGKKGEPLAIGRGMWKPIVEFVRGHLFLIGAIGFHAPDLHRAGALRVEVNEFAVRRIVRAVIKTFGKGEPGFVTGCGRDGEDIECQ